MRSRTALSSVDFCRRLDAAALVITIRMVPESGNALDIRHVRSSAQL
jgi:hypothetical protein